MQQIFTYESREAQKKVYEINVQKNNDLCDRMQREPRTLDEYLNKPRRCSVCHHIYSEVGNLGRWLCQPRHIGVYTKGKWTCCNSDDLRANPCARADHTEQSVPPLGTPVDMFTAFPVVHINYLQAAADFHLLQEANNDTFLILRDSQTAMVSVKVQGTEDFHAVLSAKRLLSDDQPLIAFMKGRRAALTREEDIRQRDRVLQEPAIDLISQGTGASGSDSARGNEYFFFQRVELKPNNLAFI